MSSAAYPSELAGVWTAADGTRFAIRPILPEDADMERDFVKSLSPQTRYLRFMSALNELTPAMLERFTHVDYGRDMALIAVVDDGGRDTQTAVARYVLEADGRSCEFAIVVGERWQGHGLGRHLMARLIEIAASRGLARMTGEILAINVGMLDMARRLGFTIADVPGSPAVKHVTLNL